jgi:hypothetical protein
MISTLLMSVSHNEWIKGEIVTLFLQGFSQDKISKDVNVSIGSVNSVLKEALSHDKTLDLQLQIAILVYKDKITLKQIAANLRWKNAIKLAGLDEKEFEKILGFMDNIFNRNNIPPRTAAELLLSSIRYMLKNQLDPQRLEEEIRTKKSA